MDLSKGMIATLIAIGTTYFAVLVAIAVLSIIAMWKIFTKAGEAGWKSIIPVYNTYILYKIASKKGTMYFLTAIVLGIVYTILGTAFAQATWAIIITAIIAIVLLVIQIMMMVKLSKAYGNGTGFAVGLILVNTVFMMILGFGSSQYVGPQD